MAQTFITMIATEFRLTQREIEITQLICQEKASKEIAAIVGLAHRTVEKYREKLFEKTGVVNMVGLVNWAVINGYWDPRTGVKGEFTDTYTNPKIWKVKMTDPVSYLKRNRDQLFQLLLTTQELAFLWSGSHWCTVETGPGAGSDAKIILRDYLVEEAYVSKRYAMRNFEWADDTMRISIINMPDTSRCTYYKDDEDPNIFEGI